MTKVAVVLFTLVIMGCVNSSRNVRNGNEVARSQALEFLGVYKACMLYEAEKLAAYKENPDVLAQAAHGKCGKPFGKYKLATRSYYRSLFPVSKSNNAIHRADNLVADSKQAMRDIFIAKIVELRAKKQGL